MSDLMSAIAVSSHAVPQILVEQTRPGAGAGADAAIHSDRLPSASRVERQFEAGIES